MHLYVWQDVGPLTSSYHCSGGVLVVAPDLAAARDAVVAKAAHDSDYDADEAERDLRKGLDSEPDLLIENVTAEPTVRIFPDAGCC